MSFEKERIDETGGSVVNEIPVEEANDIRQAEVQPNTYAPNPQTVYPPAV